MQMNNAFGQQIMLKLLDEWSDYNKYGKLLSIEAFESISQPFCYQLELATINKNIMQQVLCNKTISFSMERYWNDKLDVARIFNGVITEVKFLKISHIEELPHAEFKYFVKVEPNFSTLNMIKHSRVFYGDNKTVVDVIEEVLKENKIDYELSVQSKKIFPAETYIQYNESDFDFLTRLMISAGIFYFFKHQKGKHILVLSNQSSSYTDLSPKKVEFIKEHTFVGIQNVSFNYTAYSANFTVRAFAYLKPEQLVEKKYSNTIHSNQVKSEMKSEEIIYMGQIKDTSQITQIAENFGIAEQGASEQVHGSSNYVNFIVGAKLELQGDYFNAITSKNYVIATLDFTVTDYIKQEQQYKNNFTAIQDTKYIVPKHSALKPLITGLHFALIVNSEGKTTSETPFTDDNGCVFIKLLWGSDVNICKANILSTSNSFALPRIGSIAYVLFPYNNLSNDTPVVVGIHNEGLLKFPDKEEWYKNIYMAYPATSDNSIYNYIAFTDKKDEQLIKVLATKDINFDVNNDEIVSIKNDSKKNVKEGDIYISTEKGKICIKSKGPIQIETSGDFSVKADGSITLEANQAIALKANQGISLNATADISLDAKNNVNVKSALASNYESGTSSTLKGNVQVTIDGTMTEVKGKANIKISAPMTKIGM